MAGDRPWRWMFHEAGHPNRVGGLLIIYHARTSRVRPRSRCEPCNNGPRASSSPGTNGRDTPGDTNKRKQISPWVPERRASVGGGDAFCPGIIWRRTVDVSVSWKPHVVASLPLRRRAARQWRRTMLAKLRLFQSKYVFQRALLSPSVYLSVRPSHERSVTLSFLHGRQRERERERER